jgi:hypothetical protein
LPSPAGSIRGSIDRGVNPRVVSGGGEDRSGSIDLVVARSGKARLQPFNDRMSVIVDDARAGRPCRPRNVNRHRQGGRRIRELNVRFIQDG